MPSCPPKWIHFFETGSNAPEPSQPNGGAGWVSVGLCLTHSLTGCLAQSAARQRNESRRTRRRFMAVHSRCSGPSATRVVDRIPAQAGRNRDPLETMLLLLCSEQNVTILRGSL